MDTALLIREAVAADFDSLMVLYRQLQPGDPVLDDGADLAVFEQIIEAPNFHLFVAGEPGALAGSIYLNIIPNITRSASPYAVIENVITREDLRGAGVGKRMMLQVLDFAWRQGCYKAMLQTGSRDPATHGYYRSCGFTSDEKTGYLARP